MVAGESNQRVQGEKRGCYMYVSQHGTVMGGTTRRHTNAYLDIEVFRIAEDRTDILRLSLHIYLLDLSRFSVVTILGTILLPNIVLS